MESHLGLSENEFIFYFNPNPILPKLNWSEASLRSIFAKLNWSEASLLYFG